MEWSDYTERTVALVEALWASGYHNVGTVLQSMLPAPHPRATWSGCSRSARGCGW